MASPGQGYAAGAYNVFSELVTTTFRNHSKDIADNITKHNALYRKLNNAGKWSYLRTPKVEQYLNRHPQGEPFHRHLACDKARCVS